MITGNKMDKNVKKPHVRTAAALALSLATGFGVSSCAVEPRVVVVGETQPLFEQTEAASTSSSFPFEQDVSLNNLGLVPSTVWFDDDIDYAWMFRLDNSSSVATYFVQVSGVVNDENGNPIKTDVMSDEIVLAPGQRVTVVEDMWISGSGTPTTVDWKITPLFARGAVDSDQQILTESGLSFRKDRSSISVSGTIRNPSEQDVTDYVVSAWCQDTDGNLLAVGQWRSSWEGGGLSAGESAPYEISETNYTPAEIDMCFASVYTDAR